MEYDCNNNINVNCRKLNYTHVSYVLVKYVCVWKKQLVSSNMALLKLRITLKWTRNTFKTFHTKLCRANVDYSEKQTYVGIVLKANTKEVLVCQGILFTEFCIKSLFVTKEELTGMFCSYIFFCVWKKSFSTA